MRLRENASAGWIVKAVACGGCAVVGLWIIGLFLGALFAPMRIIGQSATCQSNVFHLARAFRMYADDYEDHVPPTAGWMDRTFFFVNQERYLHCPAVGQTGEKEYGYAMNTKTGGKDRAQIDRPDETPIVYDSTDMARNAADPVSSLPRPGRHRTKSRKASPSMPGNMIGFVSGNARIVLDKTEQTSRQPR